MKMDKETSMESLDVTEQNVKKAWNKEQTGTKEINMKQILKPVILGLAIAGCYNFTDIGLRNQSGGRSFLKNIASVIYRVIFLAMLTMYLSKCVAACFVISQEIFILNLQITFWVLSSTVTFMIYLKSTSHKYGNLQQSFDFWTHQILPDIVHLQIEYPAINMERRALAAFILSIVMALINTAATGIQIYFSKENLLLSPFDVRLSVLVIFFILHAVSSLIWISPFTTVIIFSTFLREAFNTLDQYGKRTCREAGCKLAANFDKFRQLHLNLCKLVGDLDKDLAWYLGTSFVFHIGSSAFLLYQIMKVSMDTFMFVMFLFWFVSCMFIAALTAVYAARLNQAAHAPLDTIYYINVQDITVEKLAQLNLFLSKLTGTQVGFSTCGLLIITKEFILTIAGVFLTYFAVLYTL